MIAHPGLIFSEPYPYDPRWPWGRGEIKVVSAVVDGFVSGVVPPGVLVQTVPGKDTVRIAQDLNRLVGIVVYDPSKYDQYVTFNPMDVISVLRCGWAFAQFEAPETQPSSPLPMSTVGVYAGTGVFTNDPAALQLRKAVFAIATLEQYSNGDGSPQADVPFPTPPVPLGATNTTFGSGVCLVEINLP